MPWKLLDMPWNSQQKLRLILIRSMQLLNFRTTTTHALHACTYNMVVNFSTAFLSLFEVNSYVSMVVMATCRRESPSFIYSLGSRMQQCSLCPSKLVVDIEGRVRE